MADDDCPSCGGGVGYRCNRLICARDRVIECRVLIAGHVVQRDVEVPARMHSQRAIAELLRSVESE